MDLTKNLSPWLKVPHDLANLLCHPRLYQHRHPADQTPLRWLWPLPGHVTPQGLQSLRRFSGQAIFSLNQLARVL